MPLVVPVSESTSDFLEQSDSDRLAPPQSAIMPLRHTDQIAWLDACEQIRQLASRYAVAMGRRDLATLAQLFVNDVRVGRHSTGRDALRADFERQLAPLGMTVLHVTNQVIDVADADHATGIVGTRAELELDGELIVLHEMDDFPTFTGSTGIAEFLGNAESSVNEKLRQISIEDFIQYGEGDSMVGYGI